MQIYDFFTEKTNFAATFFELTKKDFLIEKNEYFCKSKNK